jgi:hypothetical protein
MVWSQRIPLTSRADERIKSFQPSLSSAAGVPLCCGRGDYFQKAS